MPVGLVLANSDLPFGTESGCKSATVYRTCGSIDPCLFFEVRNLTVQFPGPSGAGYGCARRELQTSIAERRWGLVGESGSGKSVTSLAIMRSAGSAGIVRGEILFDGRESACAAH